MHTRAQASSRYNTSEMWAQAPFLFLSPSLVVCHVSGDNRCHSETPLVSALWGDSNGTHTFNHVSTSSSFSGPWEPQMTCHCSHLSLPLPVSFFIHSPHFLFFLFAFILHTQSSAPFINHICVISCKSSQSTSFDKFLFLILSFFQHC